VIRTIYGKLSAIMLALLLLMGLMFMLLTVFSTRLYFQETSQRLNTSLAKHFVSTRNFLVDGRIDEEKLDDIFYELMDVNPNLDIYLLDNFGHILSSSLREGEIKRDHINMVPVYRFLSGKGRHPILGDNPATTASREVFSACPIPISGPSEGYLYIILKGGPDRSLLSSITGSKVLTMTTYVAVVGLMLIFLASFYIFYRLTRRLRILTSRVESFGESGYLPETPVPEFRTDDDMDEIDILASVINRMARTISRQMEELTRADSMRRELVTNVSHDLRTPLTSLQGYLETLAFKKDLSPAEHEEYLRTALKHSDRLRKLVTDLFELSNLEAGQTEIQPELFSFTELAQDVLQKYQLPASEKEIELTTDFTHDMPFVLGDIGYIERIMENLILNAIIYTLPGGKVTVSIHKEKDALRLSITDTGHGISEEDLPHIFDRYFRAMPDHPAADGTGLGLAISRRIAELHGRTIDVQSTLGEGSTFSFSLPVAPPDTPA
jgi:signal transduction histidine kinase